LLNLKSASLKKESEEAKKAFHFPKFLLNLVKTPWQVKTTKSLENIGSFGGLNFISHEFDRLGLSHLITSSLGKRGSFSTYSYADIIKNLWLIYFSGGDCAEDIQTNLKDEFKNIKNVKWCSADTILRLQKELSTEKEIKKSKSGIENQVNTNAGLNALNLSMLKKLKVFSEATYYDLDFDNQFIATEKYDAKKGYKKQRGYFPSVATIGKHIVYMENRNGNSNVKFEQSQTLEQVFKLLKSNSIKIGRARMDCGSFTKEVIKVVTGNSQTFYIRAQRCDDLTEKIKEVKEWQRIRLNERYIEVCSLFYKPFGEEKEYRYVVSREANRTGQTDVFLQDNFIYRAIITNDNKSGEEEIINFYNQRGSSEKIFDEMNNDFGWKNLPFSYLHQNTVFMMLMAMCRNFYLYLIAKLSEKTDFLQTGFRLKKFIFRFVTLPYKWIKKGGELILKLYTKKNYHLII